MRESKRLYSVQYNVGDFEKRNGPRRPPSLHIEKIASLEIGRNLQIEGGVNGDARYELGSEIELVLFTMRGNVSNLCPHHGRYSTALSAISGWARYFTSCATVIGYLVFRASPSFNLRM
jgi:hypothetical protein